MQDKWTDQLNSILSDYEVTPPEGLWESLAEVLPASGVSAKTATRAHAPVASAKGVPSRHWLRRMNIAAMIALFLSVGSGVWWLMQDENLSFEPQPAVISSVTPKPSSTSDKGGGVSTASPPHSLNIAQHISRQSVTTPQPSSITTETSSLRPGEDARQDVAEAEATPDGQEYPSDSIAGDSRHDLSLTHTPESYTREPYAGNKGSAGRAANTSSRFSIGLLTAYAGDYSSIVSSFIAPPPVNPDINGPQPDTPVEEITDTHHDLPVRIGLTLQYPLTDRISLESGMMYTFLSSERSVLVPDTRRTVYNYRLHYLGIPLTVKYRLNRTSFHGFDAYLTVGGALEKCISGAERTTVFSPDSRTITDGSSPEHPWQWSLTAGAGLQYRPISAFGIYLEPGLTFYPRSSTTLPVIYRDRPLQFNLTLGLRFLLPR